jgi:3-keto-L-gulonate-6-phosphate decarboxylase
MKTMDRGYDEVRMCALSGASAVIALGSAPIETLNVFIAACDEYGIDAMIDMMNVEYPVSVLRALKKQPRVVVLHRGVDEERDNKQKMLPLHEIRRVKGAYNMLVSVAGGDTAREIQSAAFNDADIVVVWKSVYERNEKTLEVVESFLKTIK